MPKIDFDSLLSDAPASSGKIDFDSLLGGGDAPEREPEKRNAFAVINDGVIGVANAGVNLVKSGVDLVAPGSSASKALGDFVQSGEAHQSDWRKASRKQLASDLAGADGELDKVKQFGKNVVRDPLNIVEQGIGNVGPFRMFGMALQAAGWGTKASMALAGGLSAGEVRGNILDKVLGKSDADLTQENPEYADLRAGGMSEADAKKQIGTKFVQHLPELVATAAVGSLGGKYGLEGIASGLGKKASSRAAAAGISAVDEGAQGAVEQVATNAGVRRIDPRQRLGEDVLLNAAQEGLPGMVGGVASHRSQAAATETPSASQIAQDVAQQPAAQPAQAQQDHSAVQAAASSAFADVGGDEGFQSGRGAQQAALALSLNQVAQLDGEEALVRAIETLSAGDQQLAESLLAASQDESLVDQGKAGLDEDSIGFIRLNHDVRAAAGLMQGDEVQPVQQSAPAAPPISVPHLQAQVTGVKDGLINGAVLTMEAAQQLDINGLAQAQVTGQDGQPRVIVARDDASVQAAVQRAGEIGAEALAAELQTPVQGKAVVRNQDGTEQAVAPVEAPQAAAPGATIHTVDEVLAERAAQLPEQAPPAAPVPVPGDGTGSSFFARRKAPKTVSVDVRPAAKFAPAEQTGRLQKLVDNINQQSGLSGGEMLNEQAVQEVRPTGALARLPAAIKAAFGTDVVFISAPFGLQRKNGETFSHINGVADRSLNAIFINVQANSPLNILGHELAHILDTQHPDIYAKLELVVLSRMNKVAAQRLHERLKRSMATEGAGGLAASFRREAVAEGVGEMAEDQTLWEDIFKGLGREQTAAQRFYQAVLDVIAKLQRALTRAGYIEGIRDVAQVKKAVVEAYKQWGERSESLDTLTTDEQQSLAQTQELSEAVDEAPPAAPVEQPAQGQNPPAEKEKVSEPQRQASPDTGPVRGPGGVRGSAPAVAVDSRPEPSTRGTSLEGLAAEVKVNGELIKFGGFKPAQQAARKYAAKAGIKYSPPLSYVKVDKERAKRIADEFERMQHAPADPVVKASYDAMIKETIAQWKAIKATGLKVEFITGDDPYGNPRNAILDVTRNNHLWVFPTSEGFGGSASADVDITGNPLLAVVPGETISGRAVQANDIFRIVHDYFGHIKEGVGFRPDGEENAWVSHSAMYSPLARRAMTTETRGQNSWVNFGPHAESNKTANGGDTQYAPQKIGLLPEWVSEDGAIPAPAQGALFARADLFPETFAGKRAAVPTARVTDSKGRTEKGGNTNSAGKLITPTKQGLENFWKWFGSSETVDGKGRPQVYYHTTRNSFDRFEANRLTKNSGTFGDWESSRSAIFFTDSLKDSQAYGTVDDKFAAGANVMPVYLKAESVLDMTNGWARTEDEQALVEAGISARWLSNFGWEKFDDEDGREFVAAAQKAGFDAVRFLDQNPDTRDDFVALAVFKPAQIKSAIGNYGTFDGKNESVSFARTELDPDIVKTMGRAITNLTPAERSKLRKDTAQKIVDQLKSLPSAKEMAAVAWAGKAKRGWYYNSAVAIEHVFGPDAPRFAGLLAAMSPQVSVESNLINALSTWKNWVAAGRPTSRDAIYQIMGRSVQGSGGLDSVLDAWVNNSVRALATEDPATTVLSGPKVDSFMRNLMFNVQEVTNDAWMSNYALVVQTRFKGGMTKGGDPGKGAGYLSMSARVREAAKTLTKLTGDEWTPAEVQETIWSWAKTTYEKAAAAGETRTAVELVDERAITDDEIRATPDFRTLFHDETNAKLIREAGLGNALASLTGRGAVAAEGQASSVDTGAGEETAPFDGNTQQGYEARAAQRLDKLREKGSEAFSFARAPLRMESVQDALDFTSTSKLNLGLGDALDRGAWADAYTAAKSPDERKSLLRSLGDTLIEKFADSKIRLSRWIGSLPLPALLTQRLEGDLRRSDSVRAAMQKDVKDKFTEKMFKAVNDASKASKLSTDQVKKMAGYWMTATFAPEASANLIQKDRDALALAQAAGDPQQIALAQQQLQDRINSVNGAIGAAKTRGVGGGMNNAEAAQMVANVEGKIDRTLLDAIAQPMYDMLAWKRALDVRSGKVTQAMVNSWKGGPKYVPLTGDPRFDQESTDVFSAGGQVNQDIDKAMNGRSDSVADDAIDASFEAVIKSINFAAMQDFKRSLNKAYEDSHAGGFDIGLTRETPTGLTQDAVVYRDATTAPNGLQQRAAYAFRFKDKRIIEALQKDNQESVNALLKAVSFPTRWYARAVTQFMPLFAPINLVRDIWERSEVLRTRKLYDASGGLVNVDKVARKAVAETINPAVWKASMMSAFKMGGMNPIRGDLEEMIRLGASSTVGGYLERSSGDLESNIRGSHSKLAQVSDKTMHIVEAWNDAFEVIPSLSIYRALKAEGMAPKDAAASVLDLMNFHKKGTVMPAVRALYVFAQPAATGGYNLAQYLSTRKGQMRFAGQLLLATALYAMLKGAWGDEDDEELGNKLDNLGNFTIERSIPIKLGDTVLKVPVGFGPPQLAWLAGGVLNRWQSGRYTATDAAGEMFKGALKSFVPVSPSDMELSKRPVDFFVQTFTPTVFKPIFNIYADQTSFGAPLTPAFKNKDKLKSEQAKRTTPGAYSEIAAQLNHEFGIDVYPDQIKALADGYLVGPAREIMNMTIENDAKRARGEPDRMPLFASLIDNINDRQTLNSIYFRARGDMDKAHRQFTSDAADPERRGEITPERRAQEQSYKRFEAAEKILGVQRAALKKMTNLDEDEMAERVQGIEQRADQAHRKLLVEYIRH